MRTKPEDHSLSPAVTMMRLSGEVVVLVIWVLCVSGSRPCPVNCKLIQKFTLPTCNTDTGDCLRGCTAGYYGNTCNMKCDVNCQGKTCQQRDGSCTCKPGYTYNTGSCEPRPAEKCRSNDHCLKDMCLSAYIQDCLEGCKLGWFGKLCQRSCSPHCFCDKESGQCTSCISGWYGEECGSRCSPECMNKNCHKNGTCDDGCTPGSYGERCELCSPHCVSGCDQLSGECVQCEAGRYGSTCQCSAGCAGVNRDCDRDGICIEGCAKGYYGEKCEYMCPDQCHEDLCDLNGTCSTCKPGFYGTVCGQKCVMCRDGVCDDTTGECREGCESGYYGSFCNLICEDCKGGDCDTDTGECTGTLMPYIIGGGVVFVVIVLAVLMACCLKRMRDIMKDGVATIGQNTAVHFVPGHGTQLRSIDIGSTETNACGSNPDDTYNHLFDTKLPETSFSLAHDDLETSSGYCAVLPLFRGLSGQQINESDNGSSGEHDGGGDTDRSLISLCDLNGINQQNKKMETANAIDEKHHHRKPVQIVGFQPDEDEHIREPIKIVALTSDDVQVNREPNQIVSSPTVEEQGNREPIQIMTFTSDEEGACSGVQLEAEYETTVIGEISDGWPTLNIGKQEAEGDDLSAAKDDSNVLTSDEEDLRNEEVLVQ